MATDGEANRQNPPRRSVRPRHPSMRGQGRPGARVDRTTYERREEVCARVTEAFDALLTLDAKGRLKADAEKGPLKALRATYEALRIQTGGIYTDRDCAALLHVGPPATLTVSDPHGLMDNQPLRELCSVWTRLVLLAEGRIEDARRMHEEYWPTIAEEATRRMEDAWIGTPVLRVNGAPVLRVNWDIKRKLVNGQRPFAVQPEDKYAGRVPRGAPGLGAVAAQGTSDYVTELSGRDQAPDTDLPALFEYGAGALAAIGDILARSKFFNTGVLYALDQHGFFDEPGGLPADIDRADIPTTDRIEQLLRHPAPHPPATATENEQWILANAPAGFNEMNRAQRGRSTFELRKQLMEYLAAPPHEELRELVHDHLRVHTTHDGPEERPVYLLRVSENVPTAIRERLTGEHVLRLFESMRDASNAYREGAVRGPQAQRVSQTLFGRIDPDVQTRWKLTEGAR